MEKILEPGEVLPRRGRARARRATTRCTWSTGLFVDPAAEGPLTDAVAPPRRRLRVVRRRWSSTARPRSTQMVLAAEVARLARVAARGRLPTSLAEALVRLPGLPRLPPGVGHRTRPARPRCRRRLGAGDALLDRRCATRSAAAPRFQQTSGMVMAKGVEDTAFYRYHVLSALNEVGGDPSRFGVAAREWHDACARHDRDWPDSMTLLSTHDTKRCEDVRARLVLLSQDVTGGPTRSSGSRLRRSRTWGGWRPTTPTWCTRRSAAPESSTPTGSGTTCARPPVRPSVTPRGSTPTRATTPTSSPSPARCSATAPTSRPSPTSTRRGSGLGAHRARAEARCS